MRVGVVFVIFLTGIPGNQPAMPVAASAPAVEQTYAQVGAQANSAPQVGSAATRNRAAARARRPDTATAVPPTATSVPTRPTPTAAAQAKPRPVVVNGRTYDAYIPAATKSKQYYKYTCEFDASWVVLETFGAKVTFEEQLAIVGYDQSVEPYYKETPNGVVIYGGDISKMYSGEYNSNFMARASGQAMRKVFERYDLKTTSVHTRKDLEAALLRGELVWVKVTVDFKPGRPATWIKPDGEVFRTEDGQVYRTVLGNDHAVVVMGFNEEAVVIRDVLGPTNTNWNRKYEYEVPWNTFLTIWGSQSYDGLAVAPPSS